MSNQAKTRLANQIHDMVKNENLILNQGSGQEPNNNSSLVGKASNDEMFSDTRSRMHNYANEIIDNYDANDSNMTANKSSGFIFKLLLFAVVAGVALLVVYLINN